jgi:hypothetical protein
MKGVGRKITRATFNQNVIEALALKDFGNS